MILCLISSVPLLLRDSDVKDIYKLAEKTKLSKRQQDEIIGQVIEVLSSFRSKALELGISHSLVALVEKDFNRIL